MDYIRATRYAGKTLDIGNYRWNLLDQRFLKSSMQKKAIVIQMENLKHPYLKDMPDSTLPEEKVIAVNHIFQVLPPLLRKPEVKIKVKKSNPALLKQPIEALGLSERAANGLEAAKIANIGELVQYTREELLKFRNYGETTVDEIERALELVGLELSKV